MKWRLTGRYMVSVIIVTIITVFINLFGFMIWLVLQANSQHNEENTPKPSQDHLNNMSLFLIKEFP